LGYLSSCYSQQLPRKTKNGRGVSLGIWVALSIQWSVCIQFCASIMQSILCKYLEIEIQ
jgi:hypothetical protein